MERLRHVQLRALQHALGDSERDAVDEVALPERERRGRRFLQAREVGEVAPERLPALCLLLSGLRATAPGAAVEDERPRHKRRLTISVPRHSAAFAIRQAPMPTRSDVGVARVDGSPVAYGEEDEQTSDEREENDGDDEWEGAGRAEPRRAASPRPRRAP